VAIHNFGLETANALKLDSSEYWSIDVENFRFVYALQPKLKSSKFMELDVCGRPHFANLMPA